MPKYIYFAAFALFFLGVVTFAPYTYAETTTNDVKIEQIRILMAKLEELQKQLATLKGEIREVLKTSIVEGTTDDDIKKIQELLATDPEIYPEGRVTGYFGPLTKEVIKRFQTRHGLAVTGTIDDETRTLMEEYLKERIGGRIPQGLLRGTGIEEKVEGRLRERCNKNESTYTTYCKRFKISGNEDKLEEEEDDEDNNQGQTMGRKMYGSRGENFNVEIDIDGTKFVSMSFTFKGKQYGVEGELTDIDDLLDAVADTLNIKTEDLAIDLKIAIKHELLDSLEEEGDMENVNN